jgi:mannose-6-phosphate isomerase-like protein (cupin superfamily)
MANNQDIISTWQEYINTISDWKKLVEGVESKPTVCGPVYEPPSPLPKRTETFAIADMRNVDVAHPHYHKNGETEIYFVIQGTGLTIVGGEEKSIEKGTVVVTPPGTAHFTLPERDLVMVVINTPNFNPENNTEIFETDLSVKFDKDQYERLKRSRIGV